MVRYGSANAFRLWTTSRHDGHPIEALRDFDSEQWELRRTKMAYPDEHRKVISNSKTPSSVVSFNCGRWPHHGGIDGVLDYLNPHAGSHDSPNVDSDHFRHADDRRCTTRGMSVCGSEKPPTMTRQKSPMLCPHHGSVTTEDGRKSNLFSFVLDVKHVGLGRGHKTFHRTPFKGNPQCARYDCPTAPFRPEVSCCSWQPGLHPTRNRADQRGRMSYRVQLPV
jgi:hypothetical protein